VACDLLPGCQALGRVTCGGAARMGVVELLAAIRVFSSIRA
jgi:hypothetical protein